jgi:phosphatidylserine/phosphatidylglycerophosphate/cardiolipin synthase-like enzyme
MALARDLVEVEERIRSEPRIDLFAPPVPGELFAIPECASLIARLNDSQPETVIRLCLQALAIQRAELEPRLLDAELVATLPPDTPGLARPTERVVREMIGRAKTEIILLGYELTDTGLVELLGAASARGVSVIMICDRNRGAVRTVRAGWPQGPQRPRIFQDCERTDGAPFASMHAKCLLIDSEDLLITSANFTFHGLHGNIEIGIRVNGQPAAEARKVFSHLVEQRLVQEVPEV